tara:strand:+ start:4385 stop:4960 length:576 start_codon:yes stop_codon:yes gene_type:complete
MELKINIAYRRSGNWEHIANHLYNFYTKQGMIGQPKSNRNVYPDEFNKLIDLKNKSYQEVHDESQQTSHVIRECVDASKIVLPKAIGTGKREAWDSYTANMVTNVDDKITNPFKTDEYSDSLALRMMKKLDVQDDEYVSSAQLHMQDRFRKDIMSESESESEFEPSESFVDDLANIFATKKKKSKKKKRKR